MTLRRWAVATAALAALLAASPVAAKKRKAQDLPPATGTLIDNIEGISPDGSGGIDRFSAMLIGDDGHVQQVFASGDKLPERVAFRLDGKGRVVVPGMIDAHAHVMDTGFLKLGIDLTGARSLDEALSRIAAYAEANPGLPWILGEGWNETAWGMDRMPTAAELDAVTGGKPAWLVRVDGHAGWANSAAISAAGVSAKTVEPEGGKVVRVPGLREPAGVFVDNAMELIQVRVPRPRPEDRDLALEEAQRVLLAQGVTAVADMGTTIEDWQSLRRAGDNGRLRLRVIAYAAGVENMSLIGGPGPTPWLYQDRLKLAGVKLVLDGALGSRGAWLKAPYADDPGSSGLPQMNETQLGNLMSRAALDNFQVAVHAIGDKANSTVLSALDELSSTYKGDRRWRIEHAQIVDPADIARFGAHGVIASMQPQHMSSDKTMAQARLGEARLQGAYAWRSIAAAGAPLAFGSDVPVEPARPFSGMAVAISRQGDDGQPSGGWQPQEAVSRDQAFAAYTTGAAFAMFAEDKLGRIAPGYDADFLFLDRDPLMTTIEDLRGTEVLETWVGGKRVWVAPDKGGDEPARMPSSPPSSSLPAEGR